ncbi:dolichyl-phosphate-mannose-protein mannosyltransferase PMT1 [Sugiyamaella lignohabitans]|uniref:Dolichyl-phosphate-mannose--protein mannosyltransferase n=1 Tax=Sugiyamaella lignohabitans TaxID=796027 RepID=A0A167BX15_9ASCO|nr:dolichyl-phosphate-mannose-protein mannosyltransferase PMT1 [Sugiyamaella lignohabitans]ANB10931.1 dolichyl-phosphate-mannose-protein mannosyltransferase PMT1 [Sugiyamaella lignohabitans]
MDVHPPLAKMLYAVVGWFAGYDGEFEFSDIGVEYTTSENYVPYIAMRTFPAVLGVLTIMLSYSTLRASGVKPLIALFGSALMTFDNALATQSRYILLDSPLVFFIAITAYGFKKFENEVPFTKDWYRYLFLTGLGLGATVSSKWVGLFTIGWVGALTLYQLWWLLGDLNVSYKKFLAHFGARVVFLIIVPIVFYVGMFALHFICLSNTGDGASFMSPEFQSTLQHTNLAHDIPADVAFGSEIALRHWNTQGGYLHSHDHMYATGSKQQQVTLYPHKDHNNAWVLENATALEEYETDAHGNITATNYLKPPVFIKDGAIVKLRHKSTFRRLHSHDVRPPVSEQEHHNEVSAYGYEGFDGDANDNFRVEILEKYSEPGVARERVRTLQTKFRLVHTMTGCHLFSHAVKLPKWAFEQQEVTCIKGGTLPNTIWYVEDNVNAELGPDAELVSYRKPSFFEKFIELNKVMWKVNAGLTDTHAWQSRPESWPLMQRGINFWVKDYRQVYLIGNGVTWWTLSLLVVLYVSYKAFWVLSWQRNVIQFYNDPDYALYDSNVGSYLLGWAFHYFPSFLMDRQLFLHHYLGSVFFGILALAQAWQFLTTRLIRNKLVGHALTVIFFSGALAWYIWYSPLIYGLPWTKDLCNQSKFFDMDFSCDSFHGTYAEYDIITRKRSVHYNEKSSSSSPEVAESVAAPEEAAAQNVEPVAQPNESSGIIEQPEYKEYDYDVENPSPVENPIPSETAEDEDNLRESSNDGEGVSEFEAAKSEAPSEFETTPAPVIKESPVSFTRTLKKITYRDEDGNPIDRAAAEKLIEKYKKGAVSPAPAAPAAGSPAPEPESSEPAAEPAAEPVPEPVPEPEPVEPAVEEAVVPEDVPDNVPEEETGAAEV